MIINIPKPRSYYEFQIQDTNDTPITKKKKVSRGVQVCLAIGLIVLDFNAAACKTNHATLVSENEITL